MITADLFISHRGMVYHNGYEYNQSGFSANFIRREQVVFEWCIFLIWRVPTRVSRKYQCLLNFIRRRQ